MFSNQKLKQGIMNTCYQFSMWICPSSYLSAIEELCFSLSFFFFVAFCILLHLCVSVLQEPRVGIKRENTFSKARVISLQATPPPCLCFVPFFGLSNVIYFVWCERWKSPLVLFDTPSIFVWVEGWWKICVSALFQPIHVSLY